MDDARFESIVVKQNKQSKLDEARMRANGNVFHRTNFVSFCFPFFALQVMYVLASNFLHIFAQCYLL